ncbi:MAG: alkaline phosphatase family protein [Actinomycetota bacterium]|nr:alkaline phosphatase family protein [Actinomycetota bacterium]
MFTRVVIVATAAVALILGAAYFLRADTGAPDGAPGESEMAARIGRDIMRHLQRGHVAGRSGEIMLVPKPHHYLIGDWDLTTLGTSTPVLGTSHPNPWDYLARVPIIMTGPRVPAGKEIARPVDIAALAPTFARLLDIPLDADARPLEVPRPAPAKKKPQNSKKGSPPRKEKPKVIFTVVLDGGGWNALQEHPDSWPTIARLRRRGTTYVNATIGSAPSVTGALHATFGTGVYPRRHGIPGNQMRGPDGTNTDTWLEDADPRFLDAPTVAELWDESTNNKAVVATVAYEGWHLGMIGHGAQRRGGDRDIAVLWDVEDNSWWINEEYYELPRYLARTDIARLDRYEAALDDRDGLNDGTWFGQTLEDIRVRLSESDPASPQTVRPTTPAFARFTGDAVLEVLRREDIGTDGITDVVWIEMKMPDYAGHRFNVIAPQEGDVIREVDRQLARFVRELDRTVGRRNYLFVVSADHGQQPVADLVGGWRINTAELERDIEGRFGNIVEKSSPADIYFDHDELERADVDLSDVASFLGSYTLGDNIPDGAPGSDRVPEARLDETLFAGAFSSDFLESLSLGDVPRTGDFPEGDLTTPPRS